MRRHLGHGRTFEEVLQRELLIEGLMQTQNNSRRQQRMTTSLKEVLVNADSLNLQHLAPYSGHDFFGNSLRLRRRLDCAQLLALELAQGKSVHFSIDCQR